MGISLIDWKVEYRKKSILETRFGIALFTLIGALQAYGLLSLAHKIPPIPNEPGWPPGIVVDNMAVVLIPIAVLFFLISWICPRIFQRTSITILVGSIAIIVGYTGILYLMLNFGIGLHLECAENCTRQNFWAGAAAQGFILSLAYGFWVHQLEPDIPNSETKRLEFHLRKWERIVQIIFSLAIVTGIALSAQYFLNASLGNNRIFTLVWTSSFAIGAIALFPILKICLVIEKIQDGLESDSGSNC